MSVIFIIGIMIVAVFTAVSWRDVKRHEKHDRVLFRFCQIRRDLMGELRPRYASLSPQEYRAAEFLLDALGGVIRHYNRHKTTMFNFRKMRRMIEQDLARYRKTEREVRERLAEVPPGKMTELYTDFARAGAAAFVAYTPFMRAEIILRLLWSDLADQIAQIRREHEVSGGAKFA